MTSEAERRVILCAQQAVSSGRAYVLQRVRWERSQSIDDMRGRMMEAAAYHARGLENARAEMALIDAVDALDAARVCVDALDAAEAECARLRVALADADLILEERERQLTAALTAVAEERARCAAVCREVAAFYAPGDVGSVVAHACADEIERESVSALLRTPGA